MKNYLTYRLKRLSVPVVAVTLALLARLLLDPILHGRIPYGFFLIAVIVTARFADTWETLFALLLGFFAAAWFFIEPRSTFTIVGASNWVSTACYLFIGAAFAWIAKTGHAAHVRELTTAVQARKQKEELEFEKAHHRQTQTIREVLANIIESAEDAVISVTQQGEITTWNTSAEKLFGRSAKQAIGQPITLILPCDSSSEKRHSLLETIRRREKTLRWTTACQSSAGAQIEISLNVSPVSDSAGNANGATITARVLHASKRTDSELSAIEARYKAVCELADEGVAEINPVTGRFLTVNSKLSEITGYTAVELEQKTLQEMIHPDNSNQEHTAPGKIFSGSPPGFDQLGRWVRKDGTVTSLNVKAGAVRNFNGEILCTILVVKE